MFSCVVGFCSYIYYSTRDRHQRTLRSILLFHEIVLQNFLCYKPNLIHHNTFMPLYVVQHYFTRTPTLTKRKCTQYNATSLRVKYFNFLLLHANITANEKSFEINQSYSIRCNILLLN